MSARTVHVIISVDKSPFLEAMERATAAAVAFTARWTVSPRGDLRRVDQHHPRPLPINGHEYHRRRKARSRRCA